jgi:putative acetyltransferase
MATVTVMAGTRIGPDDPRAPDVRELLRRHLEFARATTPPEGVFALDAAGLLDPAVTLFSVRADSGLIAVGALRELDQRHGELKSMHTAAAARGRGAGRAILDHIIGVATGRGYERLSLETGTMAAFGPARALYARAGFTPCGPFGSYPPSPTSTFMTLRLGPRGPAGPAADAEQDQPGDRDDRAGRGPKVTAGHGTAAEHAEALQREHDPGDGHERAD